MASREGQCRLINKNIRQLTQEWRVLNEKIQSAERKIQNATNELRQAENRRDGIVRFVPGPARRSPYVLGITIIDAIGRSRQIAELNDQIDSLKNRIRRYERERAENEPVRNNKLRLIRQQQQRYNDNNCFELGFSHEVLNMP